ncbi:MAG: HAMP domain-containing histidine kinase [Ruminococcus sp.]|nr:HAMP domain-containing histidine kinase [Ruminococcus sp.]
MKSKVKKLTASFSRSILQKYVTVSLLLIFLSMLALGVTMLFFVADFWERDKEETLIENANQVSSVISAASNYNTANHTLIIEDPELFTVTISTIAKSADANIIVVNNKGRTLYCSEALECAHTNKTVSSDILGKTVFNSFFEFGTLDGYYEETHYTAGVPITMNISGDEEIIAFCYVSTESAFVAGLTMAMMKIFISAAVITLLFSLILVSVLSYKLARPLRQMSDAAKKFAVGDFSARVSVTGEDEVGQLAVAFNHMADSLTASEGMRRSFIANVSHELKTPMTTIAGFIDGMLDGTIEPSKHSHYMRIVSLEVKRLSRLVQSMLSLSRIDNGELKLNRNEFEMFSVIVNVLAGFEPQISKKNIEIKGLSNFRKLKVDADPDLMHQVIYNLIENAVKFTNDNGYIAFSADITKYDISVSIENSGPGIPPEDIRYVFDRFYKTDKSRSIDKKGMGLGLFITRSIMRLHGGYIYVESEQDKYCRFTFKLPVINKQYEKMKNKNTIETTAIDKTEE